MVLARPSSSEDHPAILAIMTRAAVDAGALAMRSFGTTGGYETKADASPVTKADRDAEDLIAARLADAFPGIALVAEEAAAAGHLPAQLPARFFLVDPIDGTREFIAGDRDFTVNIALIEASRPVIGVVFVPAHGELFTGSPLGAFKAEPGRGSPFGHARAIRVRAASGAPSILISRSRPATAELTAFLARYPSAAIAKVGSSLKFCRIAEGAADLYPCLGPTMEWDTAAGQAVLEAAGGSVRRAKDDGILLYGKHQGNDGGAFGNPAFVARGGDGPAAP